MAGMKDVFNKIANAQASQGGNNIRDGAYRFLVTKLAIESKFKGTVFIAEFNVLESAEAEPGIAPNAVGTTCSYVLNLDTNKSAPGNVKSFILALLGAAESEVTADDLMKSIETLTGPTQPATGMLVDDRTYRKPIQSGPNAGKPFVGHNWARVEQDAATIAANRASLG